LWYLLLVVGAAVTFVVAYRLVTSVHYDGPDVLAAERRGHGYAK
jgi:hypothetical protein